MTLFKITPVVVKVTYARTQWCIVKSKPIVMKISAFVVNLVTQLQKYVL